MSNRLIVIYLLVISIALMIHYYYFGAIAIACFFLTIIAYLDQTIEDYRKDGLTLHNLETRIEFEHTRVNILDKIQSLKPRRAPRKPKTQELGRVPDFPKPPGLR